MAFGFSVCLHSYPLILLLTERQDIEDRTESWHWMGIAISLSQTVGLHHDPDRWGYNQALDRSSKTTVATYLVELFLPGPVAQLRHGKTTAYKHESLGCANAISGRCCEHSGWAGLLGQGEIHPTRFATACRTLDHSSSVKQDTRSHSVQKL
jgi:hypothetical protein